MVDGVLPSKLLMGGIWENTRKDSWIMKVFISHAHTDEPLVKKVAAVLEDIGLEVWDDTREIMPGDNWADKVAQALQESEAMVVLLTPDALRSSWVRRDIEYALGEQGYRKRVIPVLVGDPKDFPQEEVPWILRHLPMIKLAEHAQEEEGMRQIAQALLEVA
jgi:hypothetical protein